MSSITTTLATLDGRALDATRAGRCQLVVVEGPDAGRAVALPDQGQAKIGTGDTCQLVLTDERASHEHASVEHRDGEIVVTDLGSKNGTLVAGARIERASVPPGTTLKLGRSFVRIQPHVAPVDIPPSTSRSFGELVGESLAMREAFAVLELCAGSDVTVLLEGETGTGKELAARALHEASLRRRSPFVAIDCGALPENLIESELFGHEKGAFTGAVSARKGAFVRARGGTLFLDELDAVPSSTQARLLRVLEERKVRPLGSDREIDVDLRVVGASQRNLDAAVADGSFRSDLYYRLAVVKIPLPPLRDRREDLDLLVREILRRRGTDVANELQLDLRALKAHAWPGNVRELRNVIDRALALSGPIEDLGQLRFFVGGPSAEASGSIPVRLDLSYREAKQMATDAFEKRFVEGILDAADGNVSQAARSAAMDRKHLSELIKKHLSSS